MNGETVWTNSVGDLLVGCSCHEPSYLHFTDWTDFGCSKVAPETPREVYICLYLNRSPSLWQRIKAVFRDISYGDIVLDQESLVRVRDWIDVQLAKGKK